MARSSLFLQTLAAQSESARSLCLIHVTRVNARFAFPLATGLCRQADETPSDHV